MGAIDEMFVGPAMVALGVEREAGKVGGPGSVSCTFLSV